MNRNRPSNTTTKRNKELPTARPSVRKSTQNNTDAPIAEVFFCVRWSEVCRGIFAVTEVCRGIFAVTEVLSRGVGAVTEVCHGVGAGTKEWQPQIIIANQLGHHK